MRKSSFLVLFTFCCSSIIPYTDTILVANAGSLVCLCVKLSMPSTCHIIVYRKKKLVFIKTYINIPILRIIHQNIQRSDWVYSIVRMCECAYGT